MYQVFSLLPKYAPWYHLIYYLIIAIIAFGLQKMYIHITVIMIGLQVIVQTVDKSNYSHLFLPPYR